jgi:uncharacterized protein (TIGR02265 family)
MGVQFLEGYFQTVIGSVVKTLAKMLPVDTVVERLPSNMMSGANFIHVRAEKKAPKHYAMLMSDHSTTPGFLMGLVQGMVQFAGGKDVRVVLSEQKGRALTFDLTWQ